MRFRWIANFFAWISALLALLLATCAYIAIDRPFMLCFSDDDHKFPFIVTEDNRVLSDLNEPAGRQAFYPDSHYDCGIVEWTLYFRKNMYVPGQLVHPATNPSDPDWYEDYDTTPYEPFNWPYKGGLSVFRAWHGGCTSLVLALPVWIPFLCLCAFPAYRLIRFKRNKPRPGDCPKCGYDLRATPDRCPECGTPTRKIPSP